MDEKFKKIHYSDDGYWRGKSANQKLSRASNSTKEEAEKWLMKQAIVPNIFTSTKIHSQAKH